MYKHFLMLASVKMVGVTKLSHFLQLESCSQLPMNIQFSGHTAFLEHMTVGSS
jgi:hypothetical protein